MNFKFALYGLFALCVVACMITMPTRRTVLMDRFPSQVLLPTLFNVLCISSAVGSTLALAAELAAVCRRLRVIARV